MLEPDTTHAVAKSTYHTRGSLEGKLVLEDGSIYGGESVGAEGEWVGEVVFNTSMTGYQEIITDPSYWGQMIAFTCPHIGNVGVNSQDVESRRPYARAVLARKISRSPSNWRSQQPLPEYLTSHGVPALSGLDIRRLTLTLREKGVMRAALSTTNLDGSYLLELARSSPDMSSLEPVTEVTRPGSITWVAPAGQHWLAAADLGEARAGTPHVVVIDCGIKNNILRLLATCGARVTVVPAHCSAHEILTLRPDGVLVSNGPGDPVQTQQTILTVRNLFGHVPIFGICLGHQIISLAAGARCYKLPFGHHGGNHPVQDLETGHIEITAQNHNYAVDPESLEGLPLAVSRSNLYDGTIEGLRHTHLPVWSVQYHPEASPGPHDSLHILRRFVDSLRDSTIGH